jgi:type II secretory pathway component PulF
MHHYVYKGVKPDGTTVEGECDSKAMQDVYRRMEYFGLRPVSVGEHDELLAPPAPEAQARPPEAGAPISA